MKLGELLLLRSQLQKELGELQQTFIDNAQHEEGETSTLAEESLKGYWTVQAKVQRIQQFIQATNAVERFDDGRTMMEALLAREIARKQVPQLTSMLRQATAKGFGGSYGRSSEIKYVPAIDVAELRKALKDVQATAQTLDVRIQARNWEIEVQSPFPQQ